MRKVLLTIFAAILAALFIPGSPANADISTGHKVGCYTIRKSGRYNDVQVGVTPHHGKGANVNVYGYVAVTRACQKANSIPINRISLYAVRLKDRRTGKVVRIAYGHSSHKASIESARTANKYMHCGHAYIASVKVGYGYTDGSYVRPFYVNGGVFKRC